ncbi:GatB/YqeY domain-containing protein [Anoxybacterium hadale]|uniref:GatB/YqeY domain-containing protein n=1 Tax=Anoxybacterium hadale TaxID=3408580 RepID=A0ACD1A921_9FIRM|nr:GatB/YqeY domain-containing protein [Clostridiales bacterium]
MSLKDRLLNDFKEAMKAKDEVKKNTVNLARAAVKQYEVDNREELDDQGILAILTKQVKMRKDALSDFEKAGRTDLVEAYNKEIEILMEYLPKQLTEEEITEIVKSTAAELGIESGKQNMGKLIGAVMPKVKGLADGGAVRKIIEGLL